MIEYLLNCCLYWEIVFYKDRHLLTINAADWFLHLNKGIYVKGGDWALHLIKCNRLFVCLNRLGVAALVVETSPYQNLDLTSQRTTSKRANCQSQEGHVATKGKGHGVCCAMWAPCTWPGGAIGNQNRYQGLSVVWGVHPSLCWLISLWAVDILKEFQSKWASN